MLTRARGDYIDFKDTNDTKTQMLRKHMTRKRLKNSKAVTIVANDPEDRKGELKKIGGSESDNWNNILANQTMQALCMNSLSLNEREKQLSATVAALIGIAPRDELEGMMAAQLIAAHNAAMECYRRAMLSEQTFEGRRENLNQANKLSRTWSTLFETLNRYRGKGQQNITVKHVQVDSGGQAMVGMVKTICCKDEGGCKKNGETTPCKVNWLCT